MDKQTKVTVERIDALRDQLEPHYFVLNTTTYCVLMLPNGFTVAEGMSACVDPANFNAELGEVYALQDAMTKAIKELWRMEGYRLMMEINSI